MGLAVVGVFAFRIGMVHDQAEARAAAERGLLQHLEIAVGVAERRDRPAADVLVDADRLAGLVVDEIDLRQPEQHRLAVLHLEPRLDRGADDLLGRNAVDPSRSTGA